MGDKDDESKIPPAQECEARCQKFAAVTGTDSALAMFYLQDREWDLERALNAFFEGNEGPESPSVPSSTPTTKIKKETIEPAARTIPDDEPWRIRVMSWNIDGLDPRNLQSRTLGVCETINKEKPHVVFLQELIEPAEDIIGEKCPTYHCIPAHDENYYAAMLLKTGFVEVEESIVMPFPSSIMGRNVLSVKERYQNVKRFGRRSGWTELFAKSTSKERCKIKGEKFYLMTSHLESTKDYSKERRNQLEKSLAHMFKADPDRTVIFGGDLNLRDNELAEMGGLPDGILDIWEVTGKRPEARYTWDTARNDNLEWSSRIRPKLRFDRLYLKHPTNKTIVKPVYFELVGIERLKSCQRFPSDHWGILSHYNILSKIPK